MFAGKEVVQPYEVRAEALPVIPGGERARLRVCDYRWLANVAQTKFWEQADLV